MPLKPKHITKGSIVRQICQKYFIQREKNIPLEVDLTKDDTGFLPKSNHILKTHIHTHHHDTAIDPGGQERGFSHQRDSFLLQQQKQKPKS